MKLRISDCGFLISDFLHYNFHFMKKNYRRRIFPVFLLASHVFCLLFFSSCQPKADYETLTNPMKGFAPGTNDSIRGAKSIQDLSCYLFIALDGQITFNQLEKFIPDSEDIANIYILTQSPPASGDDVRANADTVRNLLQKGFKATVSKSAVLHADWKNAVLNRVMVIEIEDMKLPSKKIILEAADGKTTLRASVKCMKIGDRWFLGEDLRFGV
jgi:hypothetical protein